MNMMKSKITPEIAEFIGWHLGDGCISTGKGRYEYTLTGDIIEEHPFYQNIVVPTFNKIFKDLLKEPISIKRYKSVGVCGIYFFNKNFVSFLRKEFSLKSGKKINVGVPTFIKTENQKKDFLRGLFDTDGSIYFCKSYIKTKKVSWYNLFHYKPKIKLATISKKLIDEVKEMLLELGFSPRLYKPRKQKKNENYIYSVVLDTNKDTQKWIEEIGFKNLKHLTKVKVWKRFGFCPPFTTLNQRLMILKGRLNPFSFYQNYKGHLEQIKRKIYK